MIEEEIKEYLYENKDEGYAKFVSGLIPTIDSDRIIGVRMPILKKYAKELIKNQNIRSFLNQPSHYYHEENLLHGHVLSLYKDFDLLIKETNKFLLNIDNWAVCDSFSPPIFKKYKDELLPHIDKWLESDHTYTVRFGIGMLMRHFLDQDFKSSYAQRVSRVDSDEYYIKMMVAWYFATALAKQYDSVIPYIEEEKLEKWTHNKTIQKAVESRRISEDKKSYLKSLRIK